jgi:tetratricopeptide (TPR) repeat protein
LREAQAMARIDHPNVIKVHEVGTHGEGVYVAMELATGGTLRDWLKQPRRQREVIAVYVQAGRGLAAAHAAGLIHRDFKPDNVLLTKSGTPRVTDFGLVSEDDDDVPDTLEDTPRPAELGVRGSALSIALTRTGAMLGTPPYMAPEQFGRGIATARTDQFSFCVALHEAVYGVRPFPGTTFEELADNITAGKLATPVSSDVPSWLRKILLRGLAVDPNARFPSMDALLDELVPARGRRAWPYAIAVAVLAGGGAAAAVALGRGPAPCSTLASERAAAVWSASVHETVHRQFVATGRFFAERASRSVSDALDAYAAHWTQLASDACLAARASTSSPPELVLRRQACLDARLDALRGIVGSLSVNLDPELVAHVEDIPRALPALADCDAAPELPPGVQAANIARLEIGLGQASLHAIAGQLAQAFGEATTIAARADDIGWASLQVRAHELIGRIHLAKLEPAARTEALHAVELAVGHGLDRDAAIALALAVESAGREDSLDAVHTLAPLARAAAHRTHDRRLEIAAEISISRALNQLNQWSDGLDGCQRSRVAAEQLDDPRLLGLVDDCMLEALVPLGRYAELASMVRHRIDYLEKSCGDDCPTLAQYLEIQSEVARRQGKLADARVAAERSLAIRTKAFGPTHFEVARALSNLASVAEAEAKPEEAQRLREQALAITDEAQPIQDLTIAELHVGLAMASANHGDRPLAGVHFEKAMELMRKHHGESSAELAIVLLNYGQIKAEDDLDAGLAMLQRGHDILASLHDRRARSSLTMMQIVADHRSRFDDALKYGEQALASVDADTSPAEIALIKHGIARALGKLHRDRPRARTLATESRDLYKTLGPQYAHMVKNLDEWLAAN